MVGERMDEDEDNFHDKFGITSLVMEEGCGDVVPNMTCWVETRSLVA